MVGLTGGIGSGKSAVAARLAALGAVVIDADVLAREVVAPGTSGLAEVVEAFGPGVLAPDGSLDRPALGRVVFGDDAARRRLEAIIHPRVRARTGALAQAAPPGSIVVNDVPLLVESGLAPTYHLVIVVHADEAVRVGRLERLRGIPADEARRRIRAQASDAQREAAADVVLPNDGTLDELTRCVGALWSERLAPYAENLRLRRAVWPDAATLLPYDPTWPAQYARLAARIARTVGPAARSLDHVGSTAVPGLPAEDTVDIQLGVADLAAADAVADALAAAGLPRTAGLPRPAGLPRTAGVPRRAGLVDAAGERRDEPRPAGEPERSPERLHGSADPGRSVNLHVRVVGSPAWRYALLMRDFLRADDAGRSEYADLEQRLADRPPGRAERVAAEDLWFEAVLPRMEDWASRTGWTP